MPAKAYLIDESSNTSLESFPTAFGQILGVTTYQKEKSYWESVSWEQGVGENVLVAPDGDGSIEICDLIIAGEKKSGGALTLHFDDGTNEKNVLLSSVDDSATNLSINLTGKIQGWQGAILYYTVTGDYIGSITITYVKHNKDNSLTYPEMALKYGW